MKKILMCCLLLASIFTGCSRSTTQMQTKTTGQVSSQFNIHWQNHGGNSFANNIIENKLSSSPNFSEETIDISDGEIRSNPVIYSDESNNQFAMVLIHQTNGNLILRKYDVNGSFKPSDSFNESTFESDNLGHQLSLLEDSSGMHVIVAHKKGVSKVNATTGEIVKEAILTNGANRTLVHNNNIYVQSQNNVVKLDNQLEIIKKTQSHNLTTENNKMPMVINKNQLYVESNNRIDCFTIIDFTSCGSQSIESSNETISNMAAYENGLFFSTILEISDAYALDTPFDHNSVRFYELNADRHEQLNTYMAQYQTQMSDGSIKEFIGDNEYTSLIIYGTTIYLPSYNTDRFNFISDGFNHHGLTKLSANSIAGILGLDTIEVLEHSYIDGDHIKKVSRFSAMDMGTGQILGVFNINKPLHTIHENGDYWPQVFKLKNSDDDISTYHTHIQINENTYSLTDKDFNVTGMSIGQNMIILAGKSNNATKLSVITQN